MAARPWLASPRRDRGRIIKEQRLRSDRGAGRSPRRGGAGASDPNRNGKDRTTGTKRNRREEKARGDNPGTAAETRLALPAAEHLLSHLPPPRPRATLKIPKKKRDSTAQGELILGRTAILEALNRDRVRISPDRAGSPMQDLPRRQTGWAMTQHLKAPFSQRGLGRQRRRREREKGRAPDERKVGLRQGQEKQRPLRERRWPGTPRMARARVPPLPRRMERGGMED